MNETLAELLKTQVDRGGSDLHLVSRAPAQIRIDGRLVAMGESPLTGAQIDEMVLPLLNETELEDFKRDGEVDLAIEPEGVGRFRVNLYRALGDSAAAFRVIPTTVPSLDDLGAPAIYKEIVKREKGLVLVTGPTGSGKSTTLAAMLNEINITERKHIITVEDPVEFVHQNKECLFSHRCVGKDTQSFPAALKYALREDPDIILIGEMRDRHTISAALTAAETGHLVFGTLHTNSAAQTINRIIDVFSGDEQPQIRAQLSVSMVAVIAQILVPKIGGGRAAVPEIMLGTPAIANLMREGKIHQIPSQMHLSKAQGMQTQSQVLLELVQKGAISRDDAMRYSYNPDEIQRAGGSAPGAGRR